MKTFGFFSVAVLMAVFSFSLGRAGERKARSRARIRQRLADLE